MSTPAIDPSHGSKTEVFYNGFAISVYSSNSTTSRQRDKADASTYRSTTKRYTVGLADTTMTIDGFYDGEPDRIDQLMTAAINSDSEGVLSHFPAGCSVGARGKSVFATSTKYEISSPIANTVGVSMEASAGISGIVDNVRSLVFEQAVTANGTSAVIDYGAVSSKVGSLTVHGFTVGTNLVVKLQDSADNSTFADAATVTLSGGTLLAPVHAAMRALTTNPLRRYARITWTGTSGSIILAAVGR